MGDVRCITKGHYVVCPVHRACHSPRTDCVRCEEAEHRHEKNDDSNDHAAGQSMSNDKPRSNVGQDAKKGTKDKKRPKAQQTIKQQRKERQREKSLEVTRST